MIHQPSIEVILDHLRQIIPADESFEVENLVLLRPGQHVVEFQTDHVRVGARLIHEHTPAPRHTPVALNWGWVVVASNPAKESTP